MRHVLVLVVLGVSLAMVLPLNARAGVLPVIDVQPSEAEPWWAQSDWGAVRTLDRRLWEQGGGRLCSRPQRGADVQVSRLLRRPDLRPEQAVDLAGVLRCEVLVHGALRLRPAAEGVPWVALSRWEAEAEVRWIHVASGQPRMQYRRSFPVVGRSAREATQQAEELVATWILSWIQSIGGTAPREATTVLPQEEGLVVIHGVGSAAAFLAIRQELAQQRDWVESVTEAWGSEGRLALSLRLQPRVAWEDAQRRLLPWAGRQIGEAHVLSVHAEGGVVVVVPRPDALLRDR